MLNGDFRTAEAHMKGISLHGERTGGGVEMQRHIDDAVVATEVVVSAQAGPAAINRANPKSAPMRIMPMIPSPSPSKHGDMRRGSGQAH